MHKPGEAIRGIIIGCLYALAYYTLKDTPSHFNLTAGLRLAALLVTDPRRWPTIIAADVAMSFGLATGAFREHDFATPLYVAVYSFGLPLVALPGAVVAKKLGLDLVSPTMRDGLVLLGALIVTGAMQVAISFAIWGTYTTSIAAQNETALRLLAIYFCGTFLGGITAAPILAQLKRAYEVGGPLMRRVYESGLLPPVRSSLVAGVPCVAAVVLAHTGLGSSLLLAVRIALAAVPLCILAAKHGTKGAAIGLLLANGAVALTQGSLREPGLIDVQQIAIAFSVGSWLLAIFVSNHGERMRKELAEKDRLRQQLQRRAGIPTTMRRYRASVLDEMYSSLAVSEMLARDRSVDREEAIRQHWRMLANARNELRSRREALFPPHLEEYGLRAALLSAPIVESLRNAGLDVYMYLPASLRDVSIETQQTAYQIIHECLAHAMREGTITLVCLRLRLGRSGGRSWIAIKLEIKHRPLEQEQSKVRASDQAMFDGLYELAEAYGGNFRQRQHENCRTVSALIFDDEAAALYSSEKGRASA